MDSTEGYLFILQDLEMIEFCQKTHSYKTKISRDVLAVKEIKIFKRKTYSLWKISEAVDDFFYISLKYFDE